ncbi:protealysin inhibitor emfourin [Streptomyces vilmorinianum]|uniref:protealysin inhibitor emfourin n=1 Tax=Streptomyces vilmorinianum TaxID=3051092 RepID=UPI0010FB2496|nr:protealysin inhibitor emfourin [Streptomyces vilmorinianum]
MRIRVRRTGGFAGIERSAEVDTSALPDAGEWQALADTVLTEGGVEGRGVPDGFAYEITVDGETIHCADPRLTDAQRALITRVLKEGA